MINRVSTCVVLCAGRGKRMNHLTEDRVKALLEVDKKKTKILDVILERISNSVIKKTILTAYYRWEDLHSYLTKYKQKIGELGISLTIETECLDNGGGLVNAIKDIDEEYFLVINCDLLWQSDKLLNDMIDFHYTHRPGMLMLIGKEDNQEQKFSLSEDDIIKRDEKGEYTYLGILIIKKTLLDEFAVEKIFPLKKVFDNLLSGSNPKRNKCMGYLNYDKSFRHLGTYHCMKEFSENSNINTSPEKKEII
ncbi:NTP transferase domain-containing protein [Anaplasmataceae bacterium AB001_6]|nr:NTP transferase domain-containing protein [Anaplasmataceae bacterium AB001_6]